MTPKVLINAASISGAVFVDGVEGVASASGVSIASPSVGAFRLSRVRLGAGDGRTVRVAFSGELEPNSSLPSDVVIVGSIDSVVSASVRTGGAVLVDVGVGVSVTKFEISTAGSLETSMLGRKEGRSKPTARFANAL